VNALKAARLRAAIERPSGLSDQRVKHLEMIQSVISRMAANSFVAKGWAVTVAGAIYGFAAAHLSWGVAAVGTIPVIMFWFLDGYYLRKERLYRCLYNEAIDPDSNIQLFSLNAASYMSNERTRRRNVILSETLILFYGVLFAAGIAIAVALAIHDSMAMHASRTSSSSRPVSSAGTTSPRGQMSPIASSDQRGTK
jgi:hypothetical protein